MQYVERSILKAKIFPTQTFSQNFISSVLINCRRVPTLLVQYSGNEGIIQYSRMTENLQAFRLFYKMQIYVRSFVTLFSHLFWQLFETKCFGRNKLIFKLQTVSLLHVKHFAILLQEFLFLHICQNKKKSLIIWQIV